MQIATKHLFLILILLIINLFIINIFFSEKKNLENNEEKLVQSKTLGINIEKKNIFGDNIKIKAAELNENKEKKIIKLRDSITILNKKGSKTKIIAGEAIISNDYNNFHLYKNVNIINKDKNFTLDTIDINGKFSQGIMSSKKEVKIKIHQANITGNGFTMKNHGKYIKIFGKAKLISKNYD